MLTLAHLLVKKSLWEDTQQKQRRFFLLSSLSIVLTN